MKKIILSLTVLMSIVGTETSFGKSNTNNDRHNDKNTPKQEVVINQNQKSDKKCDCKTCRDMVMKQQSKKVQKQCNCKNCQKQQKKYGPTCKIQPNVRQGNTNRK